MRKAPVRALIAHDVGFNREESAIRIRGDTDEHVLVAGVAGREEVLATILDPFDRPAESKREPGDENVFGVHVGFLSEPAADVRADDADSLDRQSQKLGRDRPLLMWCLRGRPDRHAVSGGHGYDAAWFDRDGAAARVAEAALNHHRGCGEGAVNVSDLVGPVEVEVRVMARVQWRMGAVGRSTWVDDGIEHVDVEANQIECVLCAIAAVGDDDRQRFADESDDVGGEQRSGRAERAWCGDRRVQWWQVEISSGYNRRDTWSRCGGGTIEAQNPAVGERTSKEGDLERVDRRQVVDEDTGTGQQRSVLTPGDRAAERTLSHVRQVVTHTRPRAFSMPKSGGHGPPAETM